MLYSNKYILNRCKLNGNLFALYDKQINLFIRYSKYSTGSIFEKEIINKSSDKNKNDKKNINESLNFNNRRNFILKNGYLNNENQDLYPCIKNDSKVICISELINTYSNLNLQPNYIDKEKSFTIRGRIKSIRHMGSSLVFLDLVQDGLVFQLIYNKNLIIDIKNNNNVDKDKFSNSVNSIRRGDIISVDGFVGKTKKNQLSFYIKDYIKILSPALLPIPKNNIGLSKLDHNKVVDYLINKNTFNRIRIRSLIIKSIRDFLEKKSFMEVQTPILSQNSGGATANPFSTHANYTRSNNSNNHDNNSNNNNSILLRISPELWLKRLIISGFDRVYEIGPCFRNEGIDQTHNPEFTSCEFYQSYASLDDLIANTHDMLQLIAKKIIDNKITNDNDNDYENENKNIKDNNLLHSFAKDKYQIIEFIPTIEKLMNDTLPILNNTDESKQELIDLFKKHNIQTPFPITTAKLLDKLAEIYLEPLCEEPTFIINHPEVMAPLAKSSYKVYSYSENNKTIKQRISRRFELFANKKEVANAYEEENSPIEQNRKFLEQSKEKLKSNDNEIPPADFSYVMAMQWGMPPTGGVGIGVDRLCMLMTGTERISSVLSFGNLDQVSKQNTSFSKISLTPEE